MQLKLGMKEATPLWFRFATLWLAVVIFGFAVSFYVLPYGLIWFVGALLLLLVRIFLMRLNSAARASRSFLVG